MKIKRASLCQGKGSLSHNLRLFTANNVDRTRTKDNIVFWTIVNKVDKQNDKIYRKFISA